MTTGQHSTVGADVISAAVCCFITSLAMASEPELKYIKPLTLPSLDKVELVAVPLDTDVYAVTRVGLPDLRLWDAAGRQVTFVVRRAISKRDETSRQTWTARGKFSARPLDNGGLEMILPLEDKEPIPSGLRFVSPLKNFEHRVQVDSSSDGETWRPVVRDGLIFDYAQYIDVRNDSVRFAPPAEDVDDKMPTQAPYHYLRITIDQVTKSQESQLLELTRQLRADGETDISERLLIERRPFRIDRIELWREVIHKHVTGDVQSPYPLSNLKITENTEPHQTRVTFDSRREPLTSLSLVTDARNFSRSARVEIGQEQGMQTRWDVIGSDEVSKIDLYCLDRSHLSIAISETRQTRYRLVIENRDSAPLAIAGVTAQGAVYEVVFLADPTEKYRLAYGGNRIAQPVYDTAALTAALNAGYISKVAQLGKQRILSEGAETTEPFFARLINDTRLLLMAIVLLVLLLGFGLYQAMRRVDRQVEV